MLRVAEGFGRSVVRGVEEVGFASALFLESLLWAALGPARRQPVRLTAVFAQMMQIGIGALPIATVLSATIGMMLAVPCLTMWANMVARTAAGVFVTGALQISMSAYFADVIAALSVNDLAHGLGKSVLFAAMVALVSAVNGALADGGAEGVGRRTTRAVVHSIAAIIVVDMIFAFVVTAG